MNQKWKLGLTVLLTVVLIAGAYVLYGALSGEMQGSMIAEQTQEAPPPGASAAPKAPDFAVTDAEGKQVRLSDYVGKPVVLNFWASWCGPCKSEMPDFQAAYETYGDVQFLMVNMTDGSRETVDRAKAYVEEMGFTFPVLFDTQSEAAMTYGVTAIPSTYFIDSEGYAAARAAGAINGEVLKKGIDMILP